MPPKKKRAAATRTALQLISKNSNSKRPLEEASESAPKAKRVSTGKEVVVNVSTSQKWTPLGKYKICSSEPAVDVENYTLSVYWEEGEDDRPCQFFATFKFDKLEGLMRMVPENSDPKIQFEKACKLSKLEVPGPGNHSWLMKWRGKDGGLMLDKIIGGESKYRGLFNLGLRKTPPDEVDSGEHVPVVVSFAMLYDGNQFTFQAEKISDLGLDDIPKASKTGKPWRGIEVEWCSLFDPKWENLSQNQNQNPSLSAPSAQLNPVVKNCTIAGPSNSALDISKAEPAQLARKSVTAKSRSQKPLIEEPPDSAWDVTGTWTIDASNLDHDIPWFKRDYPDGLPDFILEIKYANNPQHRKIGRQLWGTFKWGKWTGCMRFCPGHPYRMTHLQFYDACVLEPNVWPSPDTPTWNFRWKAKEDGEGVHEGTDEWETQLRFSKESDGKMRLAGKMVVGGYKARKFSGVKTGEGTSPKGSDKTVDAVWKSLKQEFVESRLEVCRGCKGRMEDSSEDETDPGPQIDWAARFKEDEERKAKEKEEEEQPWPTDMTGEWDITPRQAFMDHEDPTAPRWMKIHCEESSAGRQYFAEFQFGHQWSGVLLLCPANAFKEEDGDFTLEEFEHACILKDGKKAGPPPEGIHHWLIKWRGTIDNTDRSWRKNEKFEPENLTCDMSFKRGKDGKLVLSGVLVETCLLRPFKGVRTGDGKPRGPDEPTIATLWEEKRWKPAPPPKLWPWKSPLPPRIVEVPPEWAWDVLGKWEITAPRVAQVMKVGKKERMTMTMWMADRLPAQYCRQLWATFQFGAKVHGCMRFATREPTCAAFLSFLMPEGIPQKTSTLSEFESRCRSRKGVWPGSAGPYRKAYSKWSYRWRGEGRSGRNFKGEDRNEHDLEFQMDDDGTLRISADFSVGEEAMTWEAVKIEDGAQLTGSEPFIGKVWDGYKF